LAEAAEEFHAQSLMSFYESHRGKESQKKVGNDKIENEQEGDIVSPMEKDNPLNEEEDSHPSMPPPIRILQQEEDLPQYQKHPTPPRLSQTTIDLEEKENNKANVDLHLMNEPEPLFAVQMCNGGNDDDEKVYPDHEKEPHITTAKVIITSFPQLLEQVERVKVSLDAIDPKPKNDDDTDDSVIAQKLHLLVRDIHAIQMNAMMEPHEKEEDAHHNDNDGDGNHGAMEVDTIENNKGGEKTVYLRPVVRMMAGLLHGWHKTLQRLRQKRECWGTNGEEWPPKKVRTSL
jgi:chemotaxis protein histidine kinase CheA